MLTSSRLLTIAFIIFALLFTLFSHTTLQGDWHFDDFSNIVTNPSVHLTSLSLQDLLSAAEFRGLTNRPLAYVSFGLNHYFGGLNTWGYHLVNLAIHLTTAWFIFLFMAGTLRLPSLKNRYTQQAGIIALLAALIWMLHPLHVSTVAYIVQRMASMAAMFFILAMYFYLQARTSQTGRRASLFFLLTALCWLLALASKQNAAMLPVCLLLYELILIQGLDKQSLRKLAVPAGLTCILLLALAWAYIDVSSLLQGYQKRPFDLSERLLTQARIFWYYLSLLFYPLESRMMFFHDISISTGLLSPPTTALALAAIFASTAIALAKARKYPVLSFCFLFFLVNHLIEGTFIPLELIFEHRNYLPSMLIFLPVAIGIVRTWQYFAFSKVVRCLLAGAVVALVLVLGDTTSSRNEVFASRLSLLLDNARKAPRLSRVHNNIGVYYWEHGQPDKAFERFSLAAELDRDVNIPQKAQAHFNLGLYYMAHTDQDHKAQSHYQQALDLNPEHREARRYLELLEFKSLPPDRQDKQLQDILNNLPADGGYLYRFSIVLLHTNRPHLALRMAKLADKHRPGFVQPLKVRAIAWQMLKRPDKARRMWEKVLEANPNDPDAHLGLAQSHHHIGDQNKAREIIQRLQEKSSADRQKAGPGPPPSPDLALFLPDAEWIESVRQDFGP